MSGHDHPHASPAVVEIASGAVEAQQLVDAITEGRLQAAHAWLAFAEISARHGRNSPACRSFVVQLAKRAASASVA
jgi:hypothetical protein